MDPATLALLEQIIQALFTAVKLGIQYGPEIIAGLEADYRLIMSGTALTDDQKATAESNVESAHAELQAKAAADLASGN